MSTSAMPLRSDDTLTAPPSPSGPTVRELLLELAALEDARRALPFRTVPDDLASPTPLDLETLAEREREVLIALRSLSAGSTARL